MGGPLGDALRFALAREARQTQGGRTNKQGQGKIFASSGVGWDGEAPRVRGASASGSRNQGYRYFLFASGFWLIFTPLLEFRRASAGGSLVGPAGHRVFFARLWAAGPPNATSGTPS